MAISLLAAILTKGMRHAVAKLPIGNLSPKQIQSTSHGIIHMPISRCPDPADILQRVNASRIGHWKAFVCSQPAHHLPLHAGCLSLHVHCMD